MTNGVFDVALTQALLADLRRANTEAAKKERFLQYLTALFSSDTAAQSLVSSMSLGAERTVANIQRGGRVARGRADTQTDTIIIEWERDLARTGEHAREQLEEYLQGNWSSGQAYRFHLIATDGIRWRCYAPDWSRLEDRGFSLSSRFQLRETRRFDLTSERASDFPFFLDEVLFSSRQRQATLENIQADFGDTSIAFINSITTLKRVAAGIEEQSELKVAYEQWRRFLSIAYGRFDGSPDMFLVHTYLSIFAKMIAYAVVAHDTVADEETTRAILSGEIFERMNVERFVEDDFFHWVHRAEFFHALRPVFREISRQLSNYDFTVVREDILKGVYQELIDLDTRHSLGEYYTPDWLCERVVSALPIHAESRILDPACGSGSFLRAVLAQMRDTYPEMDAAALATQVVGIDIHPLSVQIAKTTVLLSLGGLVSQCERPVSLHVYLANSLTVPQETADLFENTFVVTVDNGQYALDVRGFNTPDQFDRIISFCDNLVASHAEEVGRPAFARLIANYLPSTGTEQLTTQLFDVYRAMKRASDEGRDTIWKFILQNSYKPIFLGGRFDVIVGNPPWLTYAGVSNAEYQNLLLRLSDSYRVTPSRRANMPHLEIAAIFLAHASNYFLVEGGVIAFVMPRSFISADQHENTRSGAISGFQLTEVWDLDNVAPLFRVPSCVLFGRRIPRAASTSPLPATGIRGLSFEGRLPRSHMHWSDAQARVTAQPRTWFYSRLQQTRGATRSALTNERDVGLTGANAYADRFTQGATIVPRNFFFVQSEDVSSNASMAGRVLPLRTSDESERDAKAPWRGKVIRRRAEGGLLYRTAISRNLVPFGLVNPPLVLLPVVQRVAADETRSFEVLNSEGLLAAGYSYASAWFLEAERIWNANRTEKNADRGTTLSEYLDWQSKLSGQDPAARFLVLYTSSSTDASACAIDRDGFDFPFVADHKSYACACRSMEEAQFVSSYLNSGWANQKIKDYQSRGLFGPRDIHKTILKLPFPRFSASNAAHLALAEMGADCSRKVNEVIARMQLADTSPRALGRLRSQLRRELSDELAAIDDAVSEISVGRSEAARQSAIRRRQRPATTRRLL